MWGGLYFHVHIESTSENSGEILRNPKWCWLSPAIHKRWSHLLVEVLILLLFRCSFRVFGPPRSWLHCGNSSFWIGKTSTIDGPMGPSRPLMTTSQTVPNYNSYCCWFQVLVTFHPDKNSCGSKLGY